MKNTIIIGFLSIGLFACGDAPSTENAAGETTEQPATTDAKACNCPPAAKTSPNGPSVERFAFSDGNAIGLCGTKATNGETQQVTYSEFELFACGQAKILTAGGFAGQNSSIAQNGDTLVVVDSPLLPTGGNFKVVETPWSTEKIYFVQGEAKLDLVINKNAIRKYDATEIQAVLKAWDAVQPSNENLDEKKMELVDRLFVATLSGDKKARTAFMDLRNKFKGLDGGYAEAYTQLTKKLALWDTL